MTWSVCLTIAWMAKEIPPLACLHVALIKPFLYSRKSCFPVCSDRAAGMTRKEGRRRREKELHGERKEKRKTSLKFWICLWTCLWSQLVEIWHFFSPCVCIYKSECAYISVYTSCSIMSLACVRVSVIPQASVGVCVSVWACTHFWQISRRITVISYFHFWQW